MRGSARLGCVARVRTGLPFQDRTEDANARLKILAFGGGQHVVAQSAHDNLGLGEKLASTRGEMHGLASPILDRVPPFDPAVFAQEVDEPDQGRTFNADALGEFALHESILFPEKLLEKTPKRAVEVVRLQLDVEPVPP
jgi:hypothetical protein